MTTPLTSYSPLDGSVVFNGTATETDQVAEVMQRAGEARGPWRRTTPEQRIEIVRHYATELENRSGEISELLSREVGKLAGDAATEVKSSIAKVEVSIDALKNRRAEHVISRGEFAQHIRYEPIGVALVLGPFNFPLHLPGGQIIPALLAGNTVVFKPSEQTVAVGQWMVDAWHRAGLPPDVLQLIIGGGPVATAAIDSPHLGGVFFTGSRKVGQAIHRQLAGRPEVIVALEMGGHNSVVVADAPAGAPLAAQLTYSAFVSAGQRCTCARRAVIVNSSGTEALIDGLVRRAESLRVGFPGDDPAPDIGPLVSARAADALESSYHQLLKMGCRPLVPLQRPSPRPNLVRPAILEADALDEAQRQELGRMEWFGPLLVLQRADDFDQAIELAGETPYGLAASLFGGTREMFERFAREIGTGVANWNRPPTGAAGVLPFGGRGISGNHRPAGFFAIDFCNDPVASIEAEQISEQDPWSVGR